MKKPTLIASAESAPVDPAGFSFFFSFLNTRGLHMQSYQTQVLSCMNTFSTYVTKYLDASMIKSPTAFVLDNMFSFILDICESNFAVALALVCVDTLDLTALNPSSSDKKAFPMSSSSSEALQRRSNMRRSPSHWSCNDCIGKRLQPIGQYTLNYQQSIHLLERT